MKKTIYTVGAAAVLAIATSVQPAAFGQASVTETTTAAPAVSETTTTATTNSDGTVSEFSPDTIVIHREGATEPMRYSYSKTTTVVDEAGNPVDVSVVRSGVPVQVYYEGTGEHMIARKIVVHRAMRTAPVVEKHESTTTTTEAH